MMGLMRKIVPFPRTPAGLAVMMGWLDSVRAAFLRRFQVLPSLRHLAMLPSRQSWRYRPPQPPQNHII
jgi:hypothetical protein